MTRSKSINLFLMDGGTQGRIKCTISNWNGIAYKIPRTMLDKTRDIDHLEQTGIYFLFGTTKKNVEPAAYIGQALGRKNGRGILCRLEEHKRDSKLDYWTEAVVITTLNDSMGATDISYLENRFYNMAQEAKRYQVKNGNDPSLGNITEEKESELEEFILYAKLVMGALGYKVFEPLVSPPDKPDDESLLYFNTSKAKATGKRTSEGFVVLAGSSIASECTKSCPESVLKFREKYANKISKDYTLTADILFPSPSSAAGFVGGASINGIIMWKDENGRTLKEIDNAE